MKRKLLVVLAILAVLCWAGTASADFIAFDTGFTADFTSLITSPNADLSGYTGPFVKVGIDLTSSTTATVEFVSAFTVGGNIYLMGDGSSAAVNVNAGSFTVGTITGSNSGTNFLAPSFSTTSSPPPVDGKGNFNLVIDNTDGFKNAVDFMKFTLTNTSGTWATAADVLKFNSAGFDAAAHIFVTSYPADRFNGAAVTGYAGEVPIPPSALLLGSGLLGLVGLGWWRRQG